MSNTNIRAITTTTTVTNRQNPYARIDWEKAAELFKQPINQAKENHLTSTFNILRFLAAAGTIGLTFACPKAGASIGKALLGKKIYAGWRTDQIIKRLNKQKYIEVKENDDDTTTVRITKNGMIRALTYKLNSMTLHKPEKWNGKWRVVIFDIPNKYRRIRDIFRGRLLQLGLYKLQESVYISPFPCFDEIEFLRELYGVAFTVKYLLVEKIEDDEFLRNWFGL